MIDGDRGPHLPLLIEQKVLPHQSSPPVPPLTSLLAVWSPRCSIVWRSHCAECFARTFSTALAPSFADVQTQQSARHTPLGAPALRAAGHPLCTAPDVRSVPSTVLYCMLWDWSTGQRRGGILRGPVRLRSLRARFRAMLTGLGRRPVWGALLLGRRPETAICENEVTQASAHPVCCATWTRLGCAMFRCCCLKEEVYADVTLMLGRWRAADISNVGSPSDSAHA